MKVCFISVRLFSHPGTASTKALVMQASRHLVQDGHQVLVITTTPNRTRRLSVEEINGATVYSFYPLNIYERYNRGRPPMLVRLIYNGIDLLWNPQIYRVIKGILAREKPDVVHVHNWRGFSSSLFDAIKSLGLPLILTNPDYFLVCPKADLLRSSGRICTSQPPVCRLYKAVRKLAVDNKPDMVTAPSQFVLDKLREHGFFQDTKAVRLANVLSSVSELDNFHYTEKSYDVVNILYAGNLTMHKGVHILIDAFKQLNYKNIKLHIVGEGVDVEKFRQLAGADSRIIFHGFVPPEGLRSLYEMAHITVVPSIWYEPFGLIIIESFKFGVPVVASNIGGIPEIIENGYSGLLFEPGNVSQLTEILGNLIENPTELKRLGQGAFDELAKRYNTGDYMRKLEGLYKEVAG